MSKQGLNTGQRRALYPRVQGAARPSLVFARLSLMLRRFAAAWYGCVRGAACGTVWRGRFSPVVRHRSAGQPQLRRSDRQASVVRHRPMGQPQRGFTLLETLMVLLIGGMLLLSAASFLFGAITLRRQIEETPQLGQHAASTTKLLETMFGSAEPQQGTAGLAAGTGAGSTGTAANTAANTGATASLMNWQPLPSAMAGSEQALYLRVRGGLPLFVGRSGLAQSAVSCYLLFEKDRGLVLLWQSERMRLEDTDDWEQTVLSALVTGASLLFYDAERARWERTDGLRQLFSTADRLPQMLELTFREPQGGREIVTEVLLPPQSAQLFGL